MKLISTAAAAAAAFYCVALDSSLVEGSNKTNASTKTMCACLFSPSVSLLARRI